DFHVTGVQTCALPISGRRARWRFPVKGPAMTHALQYDASLADLRRAVRGEVLLPGDAGFDAARRPWNLAVDQPAAAVVTAADAADRKSTRLNSSHVKI